MKTWVIGLVIGVAVTTVAVITTIFFIETDDTNDSNNLKSGEWYWDDQSQPPPELIFSVADPEDCIEIVEEYYEDVTRMHKS